MKLAFSTLACPSWSLEQVTDGARAYGYDGVELRVIDGSLVDPSMGAADRERVRRAFHQAGLAIAAVDTSIKVAADEPEHALREIRAYVELARGWGCGVLRVFGGGKAIDRAREVLTEAAHAASESGVAIVLETHDELSSARVVADVLRGLPRGAGALWDVAHPYRLGERPDRVLELLNDRVLHVHIKDARGAELTLLGDGEVPVRESVDALRRIGYTGWLSVEWEKYWHPDLAEPEVALPQFANVLRAWEGGA
jgi:sugar phosphate isomerase/epimerase